MHYFAYFHFSIRAKFCLKKGYFFFKIDEFLGIFFRSIAPSSLRRFRVVSVSSI